MNESITERSAPSYLICSVCAYHIPASLDSNEVVQCERCGHRHHKLASKSKKLTFIFSLTALILYIPANLFPFMTIELYGSRNSSTIWGGIVSLAESGSLTIALIVFLASMLIPFLKILSLFYLTAAPEYSNPKFNTQLYHIVESLGRWSMLDIFLLAVLVAIMKLGPWTAVEPGIGSFLFAIVVIFTMLASTYFDPHLLWKDKNEKSCR